MSSRLCQSHSVWSLLWRMSRRHLNIFLWFELIFWGTQFKRTYSNYVPKLLKWKGWIWWEGRESGNGWTEGWRARPGVVGTPNYYRSEVEEASWTTTTTIINSCRVRRLWGRDHGRGVRGRRTSWDGVGRRVRIVVDGVARPQAEADLGLHVFA